MRWVMAVGCLLLAGVRRWRIGGLAHHDDVDLDLELDIDDRAAAGREGHARRPRDLERLLGVLRPPPRHDLRGRRRTDRCEVRADAPRLRRRRHGAHLRPADEDPLVYVVPFWADGGAEHPRASSARAGWRATRRPSTSTTGPARSGRSAAPRTWSCRAGPRRAGPTRGPSWTRRRASASARRSVRRRSSGCFPATGRRGRTTTSSVDLLTGEVGRAPGDARRDAGDLPPVRRARGHRGSRVADGRRWFGRRAAAVDRAAPRG